YDLERATFFFGRGPQTAELIRRALQHEAPRRLVPVLGESGCGKSSLLRAGLLRDALLPARRRLGWRGGVLLFFERPPDPGPLLYLAETLAGDSVLPELGPADALKQRLENISSLEAARRLLDIVTTVDPARSPGLGKPKLLLVVDQLELALDGARLEAPEA